MDPAGSLSGVCSHCRTEDKRYLGRCSVCGKAVCEHCGNVQYSGGERKVTHGECLRKDDEGFKMIKFVR